MRTAQAAARAQIPLPRDSDERPDTRDAREHRPDLRSETGGAGGADSRGTVGRDHGHGRL